jgi:cephalosporin hydroxylase
MNINDYLADKVAKQGDVRTFSDNFLLALLGNVNQLSHPDYIAAIQLYGKKAFEGKRFTNFDSTSSQLPTLKDTYFYFSQGFTECMTWKGKPIFKTVYDMAILNMLLWELKPRTIIEIGSGNGSSAEYMEDMMSLFGSDFVIYSFDIENKESVKDTKHTRFLYADCNDLDTFLRSDIDYSTLPHPWLVVEDAHANVFNVLKFFNSFAVEGDYFFVEDTESKQEDIKNLMVVNKNLVLDKKYIDYFGPNMTCATNGILKYGGANEIRSVR